MDKKALRPLGVLIVVGLVATALFWAPTLWKINKWRFHAGNGGSYALSAVEAGEPTPLTGTSVAFLGSSVTDGYGSGGLSFADYLGKLNDMRVTKNAISGTTLAEQGEGSYVERLRQMDPDAHYDAVVVQLSTNDATQGIPLGEVTPTTSGAFDTATIAGAVEYIISTVASTWRAPVVFYTSPRFPSDDYQQMVDMIHEVQEKWGIGLVDLWEDEDFNTITEEQRGRYMMDPIHPTRQGYLEWWTPAFQDTLERAVANTGHGPAVR